jgi:hypothetical protein
MNDPVHDRFERLKDTHDDADWRDVRRRAYRRRRVVTLVLTAIAVTVALALPALGFGLGTGPFDFLHAQKAPERVVKFFDMLHRGFRPAMDPDVIANQTRKVMDVTVTTGRHAVLWLAPAKGGGYCDLIEFDEVSGGGCASGKVPLAVSLWNAGNYSPPAAVFSGATTLPDARTVAIEYADGATETTPLVWVSKPIDAAFFIYPIPRSHWRDGHGPVAVALRDAGGHELVRRPFGYHLPSRLRNAPSPPYRKAGEEPLQTGTVPGAELDVYRSGLVDVRFTSIDSGPYAFLAPKVERADRHNVTIECAHLAYGDSRWHVTAGGMYADFGRQLETLMSTPAPPYDECSVRGHYGRRWDEHVGYHNAVEVPFNPLAERFFAEQAAARRLAYFVRSPKMLEIRRALKAGGVAPSAAAIVSRFDASVVALSSRDETPPPDKVGVWSDGSQTIVAAERADDGRRIYVTLTDGRRRGPRNTDELAFVF